MPCRSDGYDTPPSGLLSECHRQLKQARAEADKATALLCRIMRDFDDDKLSLDTFMHSFNGPNLQKWWKNHKKVDAKRLAKEANAKKIAELEAEIRKLKEE